MVKWFFEQRKVTAAKQNDTLYRSFNFSIHEIRGVQFQARICQFGDCAAGDHPEVEARHAATTPFILSIQNLDLTFSPNVLYLDFHLTLKKITILEQVEKISNKILGKDLGEKVSKGIGGLKKIFGK